MMREAIGQDSCPTVGVICQSVKTTENPSNSGCDIGDKIKGGKRHIMVDTCGKLLARCVHTAEIQDRDGAVNVFQYSCVKPRNQAMSLPTVAMQGQSRAMN